MPEIETVESIIEHGDRARARGNTGQRSLVVREPDMKWLDLPRDQLRQTLSASLYPGAKPESVDMVIAYCEAAGLNVMLKPVHIVPMNVKKAGSNNYEWRDVVMPGINHYRTQASRTGTYLGKSEPEFGPIVERKWGNISLNVPEWCKVTVKRLIGSHVAEFTATEYWDENFATAGRDKPWPNSMWSKRPRGQIAKVAEAQALRMGFPELVGGETAEEMDGKLIELDPVTDRPQRAIASLDQFSGQPEPTPEPEPEPEPTPEPEPESGEVPAMPQEALDAFTEKGDWAPGWKWLNEVIPTLKPEVKQALAEDHAKLLWAVYNSDKDAKKGGGPQSKAAAKFTTDHGLVVPVTDDA